jgi:hypothetical protein
MEHALMPHDAPSTWTPIRLSNALSWPEKTGKQIRHVASWIVLAVRHRGRPPAFIAWPDLPSRRSVLHKLCGELGWELTNQPRKSIVGIMRFEDATEKFTPLPAWLLAIDVPILNQHCVDIRKQTLEQHHVTAFGYGMRVDPLTHQGNLVIKSDTNAQHDGRIVKGPLALDQVVDTHVYQRVIRNQDQAGRWLDLRVVWIHGVVSTLYLKFKHEHERFTNQTASVQLADVTDFISTVEIQNITKLMVLHQTESAELDVLRDADDGRIYVVDLNPTPWGPPIQLEPAQAQKAIASMSEKLNQAVAHR